MDDLKKKKRDKINTNRIYDGIYGYTPANVIRRENNVDREKKNEVNRILSGNVFFFFFIRYVYCRLYWGQAICLVLLYS